MSENWLFLKHVESIDVGWRHGKLLTSSIIWLEGICRTTINKSMGSSSSLKGRCKRLRRFQLAFHDRQERRNHVISFSLMLNTMLNRWAGLKIQLERLGLIFQSYNDIIEKVTHCIKMGNNIIQYIMRYIWKDRKKRGVITLVHGIQRSRNTEKMQPHEVVLYTSNNRKMLSLAYMIGLLKVIITCLLT